MKTKNILKLSYVCFCHCPMNVGGKIKCERKS